MFSNLNPEKFRKANNYNDNSCSNCKYCKRVKRKLFCNLGVFAVSKNGRCDKHENLK